MTIITITRRGYRVDFDTRTGVAHIYGATGRFLAEGARTTNALERRNAERGDIAGEIGEAMEDASEDYMGVGEWRIA